MGQRGSQGEHRQRIAPGSVVVFDYGTDANIKAYRKPLGLLAKAILKAVREPQTFWISSEPPVKKNVAALMDAYGLSLREQLDYGRETKRKRSRGGLAASAVKMTHNHECAHIYIDAASHCPHI